MFGLFFCLANIIFAFSLVVLGEGVTLNPLVLELNTLCDVQEPGI